MKIKALKTLKFMGFKNIFAVEGKEYDVLKMSDEVCMFINEEGKEHWIDKDYLEENFIKVK